MNSPLTVRATVALIPKNQSVAIVDTGNGRYEVDISLLGDNPAEGQEMTLTNVQLEGDKITPYRQIENDQSVMWHKYFAGGDY